MSDRVQEIRDRLDAATPGPWRVLEDDWDGYAVADRSQGIGTAYIASEMQQGHDEGKSDAAFIANAPDDVAWLLDELAKYKRGGKTLGEMVDQLTQDQLDATGLHDLIDEDGDGPWDDVHEALMALRPERDRLRKELKAALDRLAAVEELAETMMNENGQSWNSISGRRIRAALRKDTP